MITIYRDKGNRKEAKSLISQIESSVKEDEYVQASIGYYELGNKNYNKAEKIFMKLVEKRPDFPLHWINLCASLRGQKKNMKALEYIKKGILHNLQAK